METHLLSKSPSLSRSHLALSDLSSAFKYNQSAISRAETLGDHRNLIIALATEATILCQRQQLGDLDRAITTARRATELAAELTAPLVAEAQMVLARALLSRDEVAAALTAAEAAVAALDELGTQERCEVEILLTAHDALAAAGRPDEAAAHLTRAHDLLHRRADRISEEAIRQSFLELVPHNRRVLELSSAQG